MRVDLGYGETTEILVQGNWVDAANYRELQPTAELPAGVQGVVVDAIAFLIDAVSNNFIHIGGFEGPAVPAANQ